MNTETTEADIKEQRAEWAERRAARDVQSSIRLENLATFVMFKIAKGDK